MLNSFRAFRKLKEFSIYRAFSTISQPINDLGFKTSYDQEQTDKILNVINRSSLLEFKNYQISNQRIQRIIKRREAKGNFETIDDILEVDGFGIKVLEKFCNSIINHKEISDDSATETLTDVLSNKIQSESKKRQQFLTPNLLEIIRIRVKTVVSFHVDLNYFAWTKIYYDRQADEKRDESKFYIEDWNCIEFSKQDKNLRLTDLIELLVKFNDQIPDADIYTIEALPPAVQSKQPGSPVQINVNIQKTQLVAMLSILLASRRSTNKLFIGAENNLNSTDSTNDDQKVPYIDSVYFLKNYLPSRFYRIFIGNERVSAANVINNIISYNYTVHDNYDPVYTSINIPEEYRELWNKSSRIQQEYLGSSMIVGLTLLKLCIERCSRSLESLNSRVINKKN